MQNYCLLTYIHYFSYPTYIHVYIHNCIYIYPFSQLAVHACRATNLVKTPFIHLFLFFFYFRYTQPPCTIILPYVIRILNLFHFPKPFHPLLMYIYIYECTRTSSYMVLWLVNTSPVCFSHYTIQISSFKISNNAREYIDLYNP